MKRAVYFLFTIVLLFNLTACSTAGNHRSVFLRDSSEIADETFLMLITAVEQNDSAAIRSMLSPIVECSDETIMEFIQFIEGDIVSYSSAIHRGLNTSYKSRHEGKSKRINSKFVLETTSGTYFIGILECVTDTIEPDNVGVLTIRIINADDWESDRYYGANPYPEARELGIIIDIDDSDTLN